VLDDGHLVQRHLDGDPHAFGALVDRYQTHLLNFVHRLIGNRDRAEEVVLDAFVRVYRHLRWFDRTKEFGVWLYDVASKLAEADRRGRGQPRPVCFRPLYPRS
jgi:RNA polymerase sigma-70 factor (ECF subfamily)